MCAAESSRPIEQSAVHATAHGLVQGVGFRYFVKTNAQRLGIVGWVRNAEDGSVEIWAEGMADRLQTFLQSVRRGPTHGRVTHLDIAWKDPAGDSRAFRIRY